MTISDYLLFGAAAMLGANHVIIKMPNWHKGHLFWPLQFVNLVLMTLLMAFGIPEVNTTVPVMNWVLGGLFGFHIVKNNTQLNRHRTERNNGNHRNNLSFGTHTEERVSIDDAEHARITAALKAGRQSSKGD